MNSAVKSFGKLNGKVLQPQFGSGFFICTYTGNGMLVNGNQIVTVTHDGKVLCHSSDETNFLYDNVNDTWKSRNRYNDMSHTFVRVKMEHLLNDKKKSSKKAFDELAATSCNKNTTKEQGMNGIGKAEEKEEEKINWDVYSGPSTEHIIVIGDTGVGKSSLIKLLTDDNKIKVSDANDAQSCTQETNHYFLPFDNNLSKMEENMGNEKESLKLSYIYDTRGTQDSKNDNNDNNNNNNNDIVNQDHSILNEIQRTIYSNHGNLVKIVWIVRNNNKASKNLKLQAKFISKFETNGENNGKSIWDSVLLVVHRPNPFSKLVKCAQGAIEAAFEFGCKKDKWVDNKNLIGYTNIDWMDDDKPDISDYTLKQRQSQFYFFKSIEIKSQVSYLLNSDNGIIDSYPIVWRKDKCLKCGFTGDGRFFNDQYCHPKKHKRHRNNVISQHLGIVDKEHFSYGYHSGKLIRYHKTNPSRYYHPKKNETKWIHPANFAGYFYAMNEILNDGRKHNEFANVAAAIFGYVASPILAPYFSLSYNKEDRCCYCQKIKSESKGCLKVYACCDQYVNDENENENGASSKGCTRYDNNEIRHACCNALYGENKGCYQSFDCCPGNEVPCVKDDALSLLNKDSACSTKCSHCDSDITNETKHGSDTSNDDDDNNNDNSKNDHCGFYWPCCDASGKWEDRLNDEWKCFTICVSCNKEWGNSQGCTPGAQHEIVSLKQIVKQEIDDELMLLID